MHRRRIAHWLCAFTKRKQLLLKNKGEHLENSANSNLFVIHDNFYSFAYHQPFLCPYRHNRFNHFFEFICNNTPLEHEDGICHSPGQASPHFCCNFDWRSIFGCRRNRSGNVQKISNLSQHFRSVDAELLGINTKRDETATLCIHSYLPDCIGRAGSDCKEAYR
jgi:hypothetical protein